MEEGAVKVERQLKPSNGKPSQKNAALLESMKARSEILPRKIEFQKAVKKDIEIDILKSKYIPINANTKFVKTESNGDKDKKMKPGKVEEEDLKVPSIELFSKSDIYSLLNWKQVNRIGAGLHNVGNTCFLNSVMQCLTYTPPLANYLLNREHSAQCKRNGGFCLFCCMEAHILSANQAKGAIIPKAFTSNLRAISPSFRLGRQEDSHEFLRFVIEGMQKSCLRGLPKNLDAGIAETTVVHRIFGGHLQSQVRCGECNYKSNTFDPFLDLSLELQGCDSVERALQKFTHPEILDKANKYKCPSCSKLVQARKQFTIRKAPNVLTIQLKRFKMFGFGGFDSGKIKKPIRFQDKLDLTPYMSQSAENNGEVFSYKLYGVLVHAGDSTRSGHYYCYVKSSNEIWYCMNDSSVNQVSFSRVAAESAYILFYVRDSSSLPTVVKSPAAAKPVKAAKKENESSAKPAIIQPKIIDEDKEDSKTNKSTSKLKRKELASPSDDRNSNRGIESSSKKPRIEESPKTKPNGVSIAGKSSQDEELGESASQLDVELLLKKRKLEKKKELKKRKLQDSQLELLTKSQVSNSSSSSNSDEKKKNEEKESSETELALSDSTSVAPEGSSSDEVSDESRNDLVASQINNKKSRTSLDSAPKKKKVSDKGAVTLWDDNIVSGGVTSRDETDVKKNSAKKTEFLKAMNSVNSLQTWDSLNSSTSKDRKEIEKQLEEIKPQYLKRKLDERDELLDMGKQKKIRKSLPTPNTKSPKNNVFQSHDKNSQFASERATSTTKQSSSWISKKDKQKSQQGRHSIGHGRTIRTGRKGGFHSRRR